MNMKDFFGEDSMHAEVAGDAYNVLIDMLDRGVAAMADRGIGLCNNFEIAMRCDDHYVYSITEFVDFADWFLFSGDDTFPVPHPTLPADSAYSSNDINLWDRRTTYGKNRWALVEWCAAEIRRVWL